MLNGIQFQTYMAKNLAGKILSKGAKKLEGILRAGICDKRALYVIRDFFKNYMGINREPVEVNEEMLARG